MKTTRFKSINMYNEKILELIPKLIPKYKAYTFYIHSDGDNSFLVNTLHKFNFKYKIFTKNEHVMNVISDFIYSKILIIGNSGLSAVCSFLGDKELVIIPDDIKHSVPSSVIKISDYIK